MATRPPLRAALIGCGHISVRHIPAWQATPDADLVALCDLDLARAQERAREFGIPKAYDSVEAMLDAERLDCVDVATHDVTHTALVSLAAGRGLHVLCQKPLAPTVAEARAMVDLAARAGVRFMVVTTPSARADGFCRNARRSRPRLLGKAQSEPQAEDLACRVHIPR